MIANKINIVEELKKENKKPPGVPANNVYLFVTE